MKRGKKRGFGHVRIQRGWTVAEAALRLGISPGYLHALEAGRRPLTLPLAEQMRRVYQSSLNDLATPPY